MPTRTKENVLKELISISKKCRERLSMLRWSIIISSAFLLCQTASPQEVFVYSDREVQVWANGLPSDTLDTNETVVRLNPEHSQWIAQQIALQRVLSLFKTSPKEEHEIANLKAQQSIAKWTRLAFWASIFSGFVAGLAAFLVFITWRTSKALGRAELRAYLSVGKSQVAIQKDGSATAEIRINNTGQTPAKGALQISTIGWRDLPLEQSDFKLPEIPIESVSDIGRAQTLTVSASTTGPWPDAYQSYINGKKALVVFGKISYTDIFGFERVTNFRLFNRYEMNSESLRKFSSGNDST